MANSAYPDWSDNELFGEYYEFERGPTFAVGVVTLLLSFFQATLVFLSFLSAGDGPLLPVIRGPEPYPSRTQAGIEQGVQIVPNIPQSAQGATVTHPPQTYGVGMPPPPAYDSN